MDDQIDRLYFRHKLIVNLILQYKYDVLALNFNFTMEDEAEHRFKLTRVFGPSLDFLKIWYAIPNSLMPNSRKEKFLNSDIAKFFPGEILEVPIAELETQDGKKAPFDIFGSKKKDIVVVATLFGLLATSLRSKLEKNSFIKSNDFLKLKMHLNSFVCDDNIMAGKNGANNIGVDTPPETPQDQGSGTVHLLPETSAPAGSLKMLEASELGPRLIAKKASGIARALIEDVKSRLLEDDLGAVLGYSFVFGNENDKNFVQETLSTALSIVAKKSGYRKAFQEMLSQPVYSAFIDTMKVPDWVQLLVKLSIKMPDQSWQTMLNLLNLGRSGKATDAGILLSSNAIRAKKSLVFDITREMFGISQLPTELRGYSVSLPMVLVWAIRESRLHQSAPEHMEFNLKLDGRPLAGRDQISLGIVPIGLASATKGSQSSLSVHPLAIANCREEREKIKTLLLRLNNEKREIKNNGILVDGKLYKVKFKVTLDLKALLMLMVDPEDENFILGDRGLEVPFCVFCEALRACKEHWNGAYDEVCLTCLASKANIGKWTGFREDLTFLFDEELANVPLCSLHCEMRNTEQLLGSLGLFAHRCGTLEECNEALADYGPEASRGKDRIMIKKKEGQTTAVSKSNVVVKSFSGSTAKAYLDNYEDIVCKSLPVEKVALHYSEVSGSAKDVILKFVSFADSVVKYLEEIAEKGTFSRDYGTRQEEILLKENIAFKTFMETEMLSWKARLKDVEDRFLEIENYLPSSPPKKKPKKRQQRKTDNRAMAEFAAELQIDCFKKVFEGWQVIDLVMRKNVYEDNEDEKIDIFDVKCKIWGRQLRHLFGVSLGAGDYVHYTVDHSAMLLRQHRSLVNYSNQGFEAAHKVHRALYSRATNHDQAGLSQSINQILTHVLAENMLSLRLQFVKAKECIAEGKTNFYYRGCGWRNKTADWSTDDQVWILAMNDLLENIFGKDYLEYFYDKDHGTKVASDPRESYNYCHQDWEDNLEDSDKCGIEKIWKKKPKAKKSLMFEIKKASSPKTSQGCPASGSTASPQDPPASSPTAGPQDPPASSPTASPQDPPASSPTASSQDPPASSMTVSPQDPPASSMTVSPQDPPASSMTVSHQDPPASSPTASHQDPPASSLTASPQDPPASSPTASHQDPPASSPTASHQDPPASSPTASSQDPPASSPTASSQDPPASSPTASSQDPPASSPTASPTISTAQCKNDTCPVIDLTNPCSAKSQSHPRAICLSSSLTRQQFADINIPELIPSSISKKDVKGIYGDCKDLTNPFNLTHRPPECAVNWAEEVARKTRRGKRPTSIKIGSTGMFTSTDIEVLFKYCQIAKIRHMINEERIWLENKDGLSCPETESIKKMLWERNKTATILSVGAKSIDVESFSTLVNERYLDNFLINCVILRYVQDQANKQVIYLPSEAFTWLSSNNDQFVLDQIVKAITESRVHANDGVHLMLVPIHMNECHWGLVVVDFLNGRLLFDDGMKWQPRRSLLAEVQQLLDFTYRVRPNDKNLSTQFWNQKTNFERFGMPLQLTGTTQGSGSCGMGVILSARDFIINTEVSKFSWNFNNIRRERKNLCLKIVHWSKA